MLFKHLCLASLLFVTIAKGEPLPDRGPAEEESSLYDDKELIPEDLSSEEKILRKQKVESLVEERLQQEKELEQIEEQGPIETQGLVEVESNNVLPPDLIVRDPLVPYKVRREEWGQEFQLSYSMFNPINYTPDVLSPGFGNFEDVYGDAENPMIEVMIGVRKNFFLGAITTEFAGGAYSNEVDDTSFGEATLDLIMLRVGGRYTLDNLMSEPLVAPYGGIGAYMIYYDESLEGISFNGNTQPALYYSFGALFSLNWLDRSASTDAYLESGIENTNIFAEVRQFLEAGDPQDPDFSTDFDLAFGLNVEF
jgi:hypothetical protein